ncbi:MAG: circadian clock protein KaiA [Mastigocoleus sp. MO_167.B18]|nr:circadian clock protein KaiA [Mastigocoleus sp. MO_167.B18]
MGDITIFFDERSKISGSLREMTKAEQITFLQKLKLEYRHILLEYFTAEKDLKGKIDKFINSVFYANIPVPQIIEMHMELIDEFSQKLKLEGRNDEMLLDYRLVLIDVLAHLCELYRREISR